jgi:aldose 1-epimerase
LERQLTLRRGATAVSVDLAAGGRVAGLELADLSVVAHVDPDSPVHWGSFVMAPWAGRIRNGRFDSDGRTYRLPQNWGLHAIHGTVLDRPWQIVEADADSVELECALDDRWPWRGKVRHHIRVQESAVEFTLAVHADDAPFPAAVGWHPWFRRRLAQGGPVEVALHAESMLLRDEAGIPSGARVPVPDGPWDDCFDHIHWPVTLSWPGALRLDISADTRYGVVYTEQEDAVCVEPQTGPPDAPNLEPVLVRAGQPLTATMTWSWQALS